MASGDLTATNLFVGNIDGASLIAAIDAANLAAATDTIHIVPVAGRNGQCKVFKIAREA